MRGIKRGCHRGEQERGALTGQRTLAAVDRAQIAARYEPHRDVQHAVGLTGRVDRDDVRVIDGRGGTGLADEPLAELRVPGQRGRENLSATVRPSASSLARNTTAMPPAPSCASTR